jgi:ribonucleoside-diphosphate reductase alpha chain
VSEATAAVNDGRTTRKIPRVRQGETTRFIVDGQKGHLTAAAADGALGEITIRTAKQGSTLAGLMDALGSVVSLGLQAGAPLDFLPPQQRMEMGILTAAERAELVDAEGRVG